MIKSSMRIKKALLILIFCFLLSQNRTASEELFGHDILIDAHTVLFTEGTKQDIEADAGNEWAQRFPFIHIEQSDSCEFFGLVASCCCADNDVTESSDPAQLDQEK